MSRPSICEKAHFTDSISFFHRFVEQPLYGTSDWAAGYGEEEPAEEIQQEVQSEWIDADAEAEEEYSTLSKGVLFFFIVGCVALYVRITRKRNARDQGYQKTMA